MSTFKGKTAIVSGAALGMGNLIARRLARAGANVLLTDVDRARIQATAREIRAAGGAARALRVDVRQYAEVERAAALAHKTFGRVDLLLNFCGGSPSRVFGRSEPFAQRDPALLEWGIDVNLRGPLYFCRAVFPRMIESGGGVIVNIGSIDGVTGSGAVEYSAAKSGMDGLTKSLAIVGAPHGIRAVCVVPGPVLTRPALAKMKTLLGRAAEPRELVDFILYLCSGKGAFVNGSCHLVDGGRACLAGV
ncbi:MAG: SDR family oxidoreductase [Lentisphaerae bacterium]|nr:SDR family oxidoreductase [Lentisphaerota bacterium]